MTAFDKQKAKHGKQLYIDPNARLVAQGGYVAGGEASEGSNIGGDVVLPGDPGKAVFWDDFLGDTGEFEWTPVSGDTGFGLQEKITGTNGVFRLTPDSITKGLLHTSNIAITHHLMRQWKARQGAGSAYGDNLGFAARIKLGNVSRTADRIHAFIGFSDSGGAETPIYDTGTLTANAADLIGFLFSPGGDTGWSLVSVQGGGTAQLAVPAVGPTANVYETLAFIMRRSAGDTGGTAYFYRNGRLIGKINNPITDTVALTPWIGLWSQDTGIAVTYMDVDYVNIYAPRDTGL